MLARAALDRLHQQLHEVIAHHQPHAHAALQIRVCAVRFMQSKNPAASSSGPAPPAPRTRLPTNTGQSAVCVQSRCVQSKDPATSSGECTTSPTLTGTCVSCKAAPGCIGLKQAAQHTQPTCGVSRTTGKPLCRVFRSTSLHTSWRATCQRSRDKQGAGRGPPASLGERAVGRQRQLGMLQLAPPPVPPQA